MKTAQEWMQDIDPLTRGLREGDIKAIQAEAFKAGMTLAASFADNYVDHLAGNSEGQNLAAMIRDEITAVRDTTTKPF